MGIHRLLHSSCCFLNTNTAITRQLIGTAKTLEAEWWQVSGEAWVRGHRKRSQVLGAFGLLDFTMSRPVLAWRGFWNLWTVYFFNFPIFFFGPRQTADTGIRLYLDYFPESLLSNSRIVPHTGVRSLRPTSMPLPDHCTLNIENYVIWTIVTPVK